MAGGSGKEEGEEGATGAKAEEGYGRLKAVVVEEERRWWPAIVVGEEEGGRYNDDGDDDNVDDDGGGDNNDKRSDHRITVGTSKITALIPNDRTLGSYHGGRGWKRGDK
ncbi:hypothetical protein BHE74_00009423 [Ensete ventricosum]|nr:hypothetical protein BHE74_00009423 [Ensete ventricosum]